MVRLSASQMDVTMALHTRMMAHVTVSQNIPSLTIREKLLYNGAMVLQLLAHFPLDYRPISFRWQKNRGH